LVSGNLAITEIQTELLIITITFFWDCQKMKVSFVETLSLASCLPLSTNGRSWRKSLPLFHQWEEELQLSDYPFIRNVLLKITLDKFSCLTDLKYVWEGLSLSPHTVVRWIPSLRIRTCMHEQHWGCRYAQNFKENSC